MEPFEPIETPRLVLRCVTTVDAAATSSMMTYEVSRWLASWPYPFTVEMALKRIESMRDRAFKDEALPLALERKAEHELVGWVTLSRDEKDQRRGLFGYWLGSQHQNHGFMKEAAPVALRLGFQLMDFQVIEAGAQLANAESFSVMKRCGMHLVGDRMLYAPARDRNELCRFYEIHRPST